MHSLDRIVRLVVTYHYVTFSEKGTGNNLEITFTNLGRFSNISAHIMSDIRIAVTGTSGRTHLRSAVHCDLVVPRTRLARYGPRGFSVSGPVTWNSLPPDIRDMSLSATSFLIQLKTEMFIRAYYVTS